MIGALLALVVSTSSTATTAAGGGLDVRCAVEACPPEVLRRLWLAERRARLTWEVVADDRRRRLRALERRLLEEPAILDPLPPAAPCPAPSSPVVWGAVACAACATASASACAILGR